MPTKSSKMASFAWNKSITLLISIVIVISSSHGNETQEEPSSLACKSALLENCSENFCIVNISVINKCPTNITDDETKRKCENFTDVDLFADTFLFRPVTDEWENVTYWNIYCAKCNRKNLDVGRLKFWTLRAYHRNESVSNSSFVSDVNVAVRDNIRVDKNTKQLISNIRGFNREVLPLRYLPPGLRNSSYEVCSPDSNEIIEFFSKINSEKLALVPEEFICSGKKFCSSKPQPQTCLYFDMKGTNCPEDEIFVEKIDFIYDESRVIINDGRTYDSDVYFNSAEDTEVILLCSSKDDENYLIQCMYKLMDSAIYVSTFFILVFLIIQTDKNNFKNLPRLILYSYCVALLMVYLYKLTNHLIPGPLIIKTYVLLYIYLCHALWAIIISYEYWYVISQTQKFKRCDSKLRRYCIYGFIGWALPAILLCAVYPFLTKDDKLAVCPQFSSHRHDGFAEYLSQIAGTLLAILMLLYILIFLILIPMMAWQGFSFIRLAKNRRSIKSQSAAIGNVMRNCSASELDYLLIFSKIAYLMGFHWMLIFIMVVLQALFDSFGPIFVIFRNIGSLLSALHGTFIFFIFGFESVRNTYKRTRLSFKSLSTRSSGIETEIIMKPVSNSGK